MSALIQAELAATCSYLGGIHGGVYVAEPQCLESVRDIIRYLRRDNEYHEVRRYLGEAKILQTDLVHIVTIAKGDLFDVVIRLLVNLTNPVLLLYKEEVPVEKVGRNIYMSLIGYSQQYKEAFCNVPFWTVICGKLSELFEIDWTDRSEDQSLQIERMLVLLRNVLQVPADNDSEQRPDNDITVHDKVLWALRESQLLELLLYVSSNKEEDKYYLHLLEIFSLILREQNPESLAACEIRRSEAEKERDVNELISIREKEKAGSRTFKNTRNFSPTFVVKNVKSISDNDVIYHKSLDKLYDLKLTQDKKRIKTPKNKVPVDSERPERRSTFSVRLFLKEFCVELLSCSFNNLMMVVKEKLLSGRGLANDESYYFWSLKFFLEFTCYANNDVKLVSECINVQTFHFCQTQMENCYDHLTTDKKKISTWVRRLHLILKAYRSLWHTLAWMDTSPNPNVRESCKILKSNIFYVVEYRELMLSCLLKYDPGKFPNAFLRDLIETNHLSLKLLENYTKTNKIVVQKKKRVIRRTKKKQKSKENVQVIETPDEKWSKIKDNVYDLLLSKDNFPEIPPFDAASDVPVDEQKEEAMRNVQKYLRNEDVRGAIGLLRSARQVWPENDMFGCTDISVEDEIMALQEICLADLGVSYNQAPKKGNNAEEEGETDEDEEEEEEEEEESVDVTDQNFDIQDYLKKLVNRKIVEGCCILLTNYKRNSNHTNHCIAKLLHRIAFDCKSPAILYQASFFVTLLKLLRESDKRYKELQTFGKFIIKKFRENVATNPKMFMELLFWKDAKVAHDIESGYSANEEKAIRSGAWSEEEEDELRRLWVEFDEKMLDIDKIDWIKDNLINQSRSRLGIIRKLKEIMLMLPGSKVSKRNLGGKYWTEAEMSQLTELFEKHKQALDPAEMIKERLPFHRSKKSIKDKLVEMGLVANLSELRKKRVRKGKSNANNDMDHDGDSDDNDEDDDDNDENREKEEVAKRNVAKERFSAMEAVGALKKVVDMTEALKWLKETFADCIEEDCDDEGYPLLALNATCCNALENLDFQNVLRKFCIQEPSGEQVFWKIRACSNIELHQRLELIDAALSNTLDEVEANFSKPDASDDSDSEDDFDRLRRVMPHAISRTVTSESQNSATLLENNAKESSGRSDKTESRARRLEMKSDDSDSELDKNSVPGVRSHIINSDGSDSESDVGVTRGSRKSSKIVEKNSKDPLNGSNSTESARNRTRRRAMESDGSDSDLDQNDVPVIRSHPIDSDRSDKSEENDEIVRPKRTNRRPACLASDSEGENSVPDEHYNQKRRRCIGSDSDIEERPSDDDHDVRRPLEVRKRSKMIDSDSDLEGHGSMDDADVRTSR